MAKMENPTIQINFAFQIKKQKSIPTKYKFLTDYLKNKHYLKDLSKKQKLKKKSFKVKPYLTALRRHLNFIICKNMD